MSLQQMNDDDNKVVPLMDNEDESGRKSAKWPGRKGIYLLPNLMTAGNLLCGFLAI